MVMKSKQDRQARKSVYSLGSDEMYRENLYYIRGYQSYQLAISNAEREDHSFEEVRVQESRLADPTYYAVLRKMAVAEAENRIRIIDDALDVIPEKYRDGVWDHTANRVPLNDPRFDSASSMTWKRWSQRFIYEVAKRRGLEEIVEVLKTC